MAKERKGQERSEETPQRESAEQAAPEAVAQEATPAEPGALLLVEEFAEARGVKPWELAGLRRAQGWAEGKRVDASAFDRALAAFRQRPMGGGR